VCKARNILPCPLPDPWATRRSEPRSAARGAACNFRDTASLVDVAKQRLSRYERGIAHPDPVKLAALRALIEADPTTSKAELARRTGMSRASVGYYSPLRKMGLHWLFVRITS
jgi:hypothetical protein